MSKFMQQLLAQKASEKKVIQEKLGGEEILDMEDPILQWGVGGWVRGRANLIYGPSRSGKSSLALRAAGAEQKKSGGWVLIFDSEYAHNDPNSADEKGKLTQSAKDARERYEAAGLDPDKIYIEQSNNINKLFGKLGDFEEQVQSGDLNISAILVDSWGGVQGETARSKIEEGDVSGAGNNFGGNAKVMGPVLQTLLRMSAEHGITCFFVQHCIQNMDQYGPRWLLIGGEKLKYLVHSIIFLETAQAKDSRLLSSGEISTSHDEGVAVGKKVRFRCEKSRKLVEGRKGEFWFNFKTLHFAMPEYSLFNLAVSLGVVAHPIIVETEVAGPNKGKPKVDKKTGEVIKKESVAFWEYPVGAPTPVKWHGQAAVIEAFKNDKKLFNDVFQMCLTSDKKDMIKAKIGEEGRE